MNMIFLIGVILVISVGVIVLTLSILRLKGRKIKRRKNMSEEEERKEYNKPYRPKVMTQKDIDESLRGAFRDTQQPRQQGFKFNTGGKGAFGSYRPPTMPPLKQQERQQEQYPQPRRGQPQPSTYRPPQQPQPPQWQPAVEEPYWSSQQWEEWALELYNTFQEARQYLPDWFIQAVEG